MVIELNKFILILIRITAFIVTCPAFSFKGLSNIFKVGLSFSITMVVYMTIPSIEIDSGLLIMGLLVVKEALIGLVLGFVVRLIFSIMEIAGQLMDFQVGYSMASIYDPLMGTSSAMYSRLYYWLSICLFFMLDLHRQVILTLINSFNHIPITHINYNGTIIKTMVVVFGTVFNLAFNIALPVIVVVLITDIVMGVISRTVPQINVLILGMPLKSMVGVVITLLLLSSTTSIIATTLEMIPEYLDNIMQLFT